MRILDAFNFGSSIKPWISGERGIEQWVHDELV